MDAKTTAGIAIVVVIALAALFVAFQGNPLGMVSAGERGAQGTITIGAVQPLTGTIANVGQNARASIELAVEEINSSGGINGKTLEVIFEDGKCDSKAATTAAQKLAEVDRVPAIVGGTCSGETMAAAPIAESARVVLLSNCSSNPAITQMGDYVFRAFPSDNFQGKFAAEFAFKELGARNVAVLSCLAAYCDGISAVFKREFPRLGGQIVADEKFEQESVDMRTQLLKIRDSGAELVYFLGMTAESSVGIRQARELGISARLLGADAWDDPALWSSLGEAGEGAMYSSVSVPANSEFMAYLAGEVGKGNETMFCSSQAYDAVKILANAMKACGTNSECIKGELYKVKNYNGISGSISFDPNGDLESANYSVKTVKGGKAVDFS